MKKNNRDYLLLVEDDDLFRKVTSEILLEKYEVSAAESAEVALRILQQSVPDLVLLDITLPGLDGIEMLKKLKANYPYIPVVMLTALEKIPKVVESIKLGAYDYLTKPVLAEELFLTIEHALESMEIKGELIRRRQLQLLDNKEYLLIGNSPALNRIRQEIQIVGKSNSVVLIEGETGTGKELVARSIHAQSQRASSSFVALNCGAIPKDLMEAELFGHKKGAFTSAQSDEIGKFKLADHGTLLLDEISEMSAEAQAKLLRVVEEQAFYPVGSSDLMHVDVRILVSTNRNLQQLVEKKLFRQDLFFRLNVYTIFIPPLRERPEEIMALAEHFMQQFNHKFGKKFSEIKPAAKAILMHYKWPGNVRELRNLMERVVLANDGEVITPQHLFFLQSPADTAAAEAPEQTPESGDGETVIGSEGLDDALAVFEKKLLIQALNDCHWNKTKAAKLLKLSSPAFYYRLEKYGLA